MGARATVVRTGHIACFAAALSWLLRPGAALASSEDDFFVGNRAAMTGGAVTATVDDGSAAFYNHAGLASVTRARLDVSAAAYALRLYNIPNFLSVAGRSGIDADVTEFVAIPTEIAYTRKLGTDLTLGLGYFVPKAENSLFSERVTDVNGDIESTWALESRSTRTSYWLVAALGLHLAPSVRLGFGLFGVYEDGVNSITFFGSTARAGTTETVFEISSLQKSTRLGGAPGVGLQLDLGLGLTLGLWARGPRVQLASGVKTSDNQVTGEMQPDGSTELLADSRSSDDSGEQVGLVSLGRYHAGLAYRYERWMVSAEVDVQPGLDRVSTATSRVLAINARAGVSHDLTPHVAFGAGLFSDRGSEDEALDYYGGTLGVEFQEVLGLAAGEAADDLVLVTAFALRYACGSGEVASLRADPEPPGPLLDLSTSTLTVHEFGLHVGSGLLF